MIRRTSLAVTVCLAALVVAGAARAADEGIKLEYKFKPGEVLRYKLAVDMDLAMQSDMAGSAQMPAMHVKMVGVMKQKTLRILPDGDAEVLVAVESMKMMVGGQTQKVPLDKIPTITLVVSREGLVKKMSGLDEAAGLLAGMPFAGAANPGQGGAFPSQPVKVGEVWSQKVPFPMGGMLNTRSQLTSTNSKVGKYRVAAIKQDVGGSIDLAMPGLMFSPAGRASDESVDIGMKGMVMGDSMVYFSVEHGRLIRTQGSADAQVAMDLSGGMAGGQMQVDMHTTFEMFLLPGK